MFTSIRRMNRNKTIASTNMYNVAWPTPGRSQSRTFFVHGQEMPVLQSQWQVSGKSNNNSFAEIGHLLRYHLATALWMVRHPSVHSNHKALTAIESVNHSWLVRRAMVARWWEHSPPTSVAQLQISASKPSVGWVCGWFFPLFREVYLRVLRFSPFLKNQYFQTPIRAGTRGHVQTSF